MKNCGVRLRLGATFGLLAAVLFIVGWQGVHHLRQLDRKMQEAIFDRWSEEQQVHEVFRLSNLNSRLTLSVFLLDDADEIQRLLVQRAANADRISGLIRAIELGLDTEEEKRLLAAVEAARKPYAESYQQALAKLVDGHQRDEARKMMAGITLPRIAVYHAAWEAFTQCQVDEIERAIKQSKANFAAAQRSLLFLVILAVLITVAIAGYVTFRVTREVAERVRAEEALRQSNDQLEQRVQQRTAELGKTNQVLQAEITDRKRTEEKMRRMATVVRDSNDAITIQDFEGRITAWNRGAELMYGYSEAEALQMSIWRVTPPAKMAEKKAFFARLMAGEVVTAFETQRLTKDGRVLDVWLTVTKLMDEAGKPVGIASTERDVTERKREKEKLRETNDYLENLINHANAPIIVWDPQFKITRFNYAFETLTGRRADEVIGKPIEILFPPALVESSMELIAKTQTGERWETVEIHIQHIDGTRRIVLWNSATLFALDGKMPVATVAQGIDITERKRTQAELENVHQQLLEAARQSGMAEIASNVLHNVGNVLNSVNVSTGLIVASVKKSSAASLGRVVALLREHAHDLGAFITHDARGKHVPEFLAHLSEQLMAEQQAIISEVDSLLEDVEHIKEIVAMQQSYAKIGGAKEIINVVNLVEMSIRMNETALKRHRVEIIREFEKVPLMNVERHKILQILINLLRNSKNACSESDRADKRLTVRVANGEGRIKISMLDNGIGIPPENLARIFTHGFTTRKDGHGFGLHSSVLAAKEMGGSLTVHSDGPGQGAAFTLELPCPAREDSHG